LYKMMNKKAQSEVIAVLLILAVTVGAVAVAYRWAVPRVEESKDVARAKSMQNFLLELDSKIREVRFSGEGAQRFIELDFDKGELRIHPAPQNDITYHMTTYAKEELMPYERRLDTNVENNELNIVLKYGEEIEIEIAAGNELFIPAGSHILFIRNMGGNIVRISRSAAYIGSAEKILIQGYVYDNTGYEVDTPSMDSKEALAYTEIIVTDHEDNIVTSTKTNSYGKYALMLPRNQKCYFRVNKTSYVMKEWDGMENVKVEKYHKDFHANETEWVINGVDTDQLKYDADGVGTLNFPLYMVEKPDILESAPIAIIIYTGADTPGSIDDPYYNGIVYDIMDGLSESGEINCKYFVVYSDFGGDEEPRNFVNTDMYYPGTTQPIYIYPIKWLFEGSDSTQWSVAGEVENRFNEIAQIGGDPNKLEYHDFSLIVVGTGAANDDDLLTISGTGKLIEYREDMSNFLSLGKLEFKGIEYARSLITFSQFEEVGKDEEDISNHPYQVDLDTPIISNPTIARDEKHSTTTTLGDVAHGDTVIIAAHAVDPSGVASVNAEILDASDNVVAGVAMLDNGNYEDYCDIYENDNVYTGKWIVPQDASGEYKVVITAIDEVGNKISTEDDEFPSAVAANLRIKVTDNMLLPTLSVTEPADNLITNNSTVKVSGSVSDATVPGSDIEVTVKVGTYEEKKTITEGSNFTFYVKLTTEGENTITISAENIAGNKSEVTRTVNLDETQPTIDTYSPTGTLTGDLPLSRTIQATYSDDNSGIDTGKVIMIFDSSDVTSSPDTTINGDSISYDASITEDGTHAVFVFVEDKAGNSTGRYWTFNVNKSSDSERPKLTITNPPEGYTTTSSVTVSGNTEANATVTVDVWPWHSGGHCSTTADDAGDFSCSVSLTEGKNVIVVKSEKDMGGDSTPEVHYEMRYVILDADNPTVSIISPTSIYKRKGQTVSVVFEYTEENPKEYTIEIKNGATTIGSKTSVFDPKISGAVTIKDTVSLSSDAAEGNYDVEVTVKDEVDNSVTVTSSEAVTIDNTPPTSGAISPANGSTVPQPTTITITINDASSGIDLSSIRMIVEGVDITENATITDLGPGGINISYTPTNPFTNDNEITVTVDAEDNVGNEMSQQVSTFYVNIEGPIITNVDV
ncbi:hypothetical protein DRQ26_04400, partial [bacterium]